MNIVKKLIGTIFPAYRYKLEREGNEALMSGIIRSLPDTYNFLKDQKRETKTLHFNERQDIAGFKFISQLYPEETIKKYTDKTKNIRLFGIQLYSKRTNEYEDVDLLINDGHISGIKISNSNYEYSEFDIERIKVDKLKEEKFIFPPSDIDLFFQSLDEKDQERIDETGFMDIQLGNRTYYTIFDMEDGNYIGIDKKLKVYSLVHDAVPMAKLLKKSLDEILSELKNGEFNIDEHLNERYTKSR